MPVSRAAAPLLPIWNETIALFGGRFDPPHRGHFQAIRGLFLYPGVKEVWILPSPTPPHKSAIASIEDRTEMVKLGLLRAHPNGDHEKVRVDLREALRAQAHPDRPSYSFDTIQEVRREVGNPAFVIGTDQLEQMQSWHRFPEILELCHWIVLARKPDGSDRGQRKLQEWQGSGLAQKTSRNDLWILKGGKTQLILVPTEAMELSSTRIREEISRTGHPPQESIHPDVLSYMQNHQLYGIQNDSCQSESRNDKVRHRD